MKVGPGPGPSFVRPTHSESLTDLEAVRQASRGRAGLGFGFKLPVTVVPGPDSDRGIFKCIPLPETHRIRDSGPWQTVGHGRGGCRLWRRAAAAAAQSSRALTFCSEKSFPQKSLCHGSEMGSTLQWMARDARSRGVPPRGLPRQRLPGCAATTRPAFPRVERRPGAGRCGQIRLPAPHCGHPPLRQILLQMLLQASLCSDTTGATLDTH